MKTVLDQSDSEFLSELHRLGPRTVHDIAEAIGVTATAIRQRLSRLQAQGFVQRNLVRAGRGRPHYTYCVTGKGLRQIGDNYGDLALILWRELHRIPDPDVRNQVTARIRDALVARFGNVHGATVKERLDHLCSALLERGYDLEVSATNGLPILRENNCPYQELADEDREICHLEVEVFQRVLGTDVQLTQCCLDGHYCCEFVVGSKGESSFP